MKPHRLAPNLIRHFYAGGERIARLRGLEGVSSHQPEEWIGATVARAEQWPIGLAHTVDGLLLRDLVIDDPEAWVGGPVQDGDTGVLLKLLDAGQRLPVHVHPDRAFARSHLDCPYGKTEAWFVLEADPGSAVHLGWSADVDPAELDRRREAQDGDWMLDHMHRIEVRPGDGVVVPAGLVHAIGAGILVAEAQEPTDFSILLEWSITTSTRDESHLGLGFDTAMQAVDTAALPPELVGRLVTHTPLDQRGDGLAPILAESAEPYFRMGLAAPLDASVDVPRGFSLLVVISGHGTLHGRGDDFAVRAGDTVAVPAAFGPYTIAGPVQALVVQPGLGWPESL